MYRLANRLPYGQITRTQAAEVPLRGAIVSASRLDLDPCQCIASPSLAREEARSQADFYRERCAAYGKQSTAIALRRDIYVGETSADCESVSNPGPAVFSLPD
jgi:hypothetical protein